MPTQTVFPAEQLKLSFHTLFYNFSRYWLGGASLLRWVIGVLLLGAVLEALRWPRDGWWLTGVFLVLLVALLILLHHLRRHDFVTFGVMPLPKVTPSPLDIKEKIPVFATGLFTVQSKYQRYTWLPGFYRTFATRERALLCQVQDQKFLKISRWPETEIGLWYVFFMPDHVQQIHWGTLRFGGNTHPALAIIYRMNTPEQKRQKGTQEQTLYLAVQSEADGHMILADLAYDIPARAFASIAAAPASSSHA